MQDIVSGSPLFARLDEAGQLRLVLDSSPMAMIVIDDTATILSFSKAAEALFGYSEHEIVGEPISLLMAPQHRERYLEYLATLLHDIGETQNPLLGARIEYGCDREGRVFPVEVSASMIELDSGRYFAGFLRSVNGAEQSQLELQSMLGELAHMSRVSAMGALATAIAHELNQPLTSIANYAAGARDILGKRSGQERENAELVRILDLCSKQAVRAGQLLHRLRDFVKAGEPHRVKVSAGTLANDAVQLALINGYRRHVKVDIDVEPGLPPLMVDQLQAQQVLFNLIRNAFEAMHAEEGYDHRVRISATQREPDFVAFTVEDSGPGIDPDVRETLFESFVTTKGGGMGVGLAICRQIVGFYGRDIVALPNSKLGGAAFRFTLPVRRPEETAVGS